MKRVLVERELTSEGPVRLGTVVGTAKGKARSVTVNLRESPIAWLHARGHLSARQHNAGETLRDDYERANLPANTTMRWDPVMTKADGPAELNPSEKALAAKQRFGRAMAAAGKGLEDVLWRVVCAGDGIPETEKALGWPARSGKLVLSIALDRVADYYRIQ